MFSSYTLAAKSGWIAYALITTFHCGMWKEVQGELSRCLYVPELSHLAGQLVEQLDAWMRMPEKKQAVS